MNESEMEQFESQYWFTAIFFILIYNVIAVIVVELTRRYKYFQIFLYCSLYCVTPIYAHYDTLSLFGWAKIYSIQIAGIIIFLIRYYKQSSFLLWMGTIMVMLNITEAILLEISLIIDNDFFYLNFISAIILLLCFNLPLKSTIKNTFFLNEAVYDTFNYDVGIYWILLYSIWNFVFALNYKCYEKLLISTVHIGVPLYFLLFKNIAICSQLKLDNALYSEWIFLRMVALLFWLYIESMPFDELIPFWDILECDRQSANVVILWIFNIISVLFAIVVLIQQILDIYAVRNTESETKTLSFIQLVIGSNTLPKTEQTEVTNAQTSSH